MQNELDLGSKDTQIELDLGSGDTQNELDFKFKKLAIFSYKYLILNVFWFSFSVLIVWKTCGRS